MADAIEAQLLAETGEAAMSWPVQLFHISTANTVLMGGSYVRPSNNRAHFLSGVRKKTRWLPKGSFSLDDGNSALVRGFLVETNFEASKTLFPKAFQSLKHGLH